MFVGIFLLDYDIVVSICVDGCASFASTDLMMIKCFCANGACFECCCDLLQCRGVGAIVHKLVESMVLLRVVYKPPDFYIGDTTAPLDWQYAILPILITGNAVGFVGLASGLSIMSWLGCDINELSCAHSSITFAVPGSMLIKCLLISLCSNATLMNLFALMAMSRLLFLAGSVSVCRSSPCATATLMSLFVLMAMHRLLMLA